MRHKEMWRQEKEKMNGEEKGETHTHTFNGPSCRPTNSVKALKAKREKREKKEKK